MWTILLFYFKSIYFILNPFFFIATWAPLGKGNGAPGSGTRIKHRIQGGLHPGRGGTSDSLCVDPECRCFPKSTATATASLRVPNPYWESPLDLSIWSPVGTLTVACSKLNPALLFCPNLFFLCSRFSWTSPLLPHPVTSPKIPIASSLCSCPHCLWLLSSSQLLHTDSCDRHLIGLLASLFLFFSVFLLPPLYHCQN